MLQCRALNNNESKVIDRNNIFNKLSQKRQSFLSTPIYDYVT